MSIDQPADNEPAVPAGFESELDWRGGAVAGAAAAAAMGVGIGVVDLDTLRVAIAGLYGAEGNLAVGAFVHLVHGAVFGVVFAAVLADPSLHRVAVARWKATVAGVVYGLALSVVGTGIVMPIWLDVVGFPTPPAIPNVTGPIVAWHVVYGLVLGALFPSLGRR